MRKYAINSTCGARTRNLGPFGKDPYPDYKMARVLDILRAGALAKFPDAIQTRRYFPLSESRVKGRAPTLRTQKKTTARQTGCPGNVLIPRRA